MFKIHSDFQMSSITEENFADQQSQSAIFHILPGELDLSTELISKLFIVADFRLVIMELTSWSNDWN